MDEFVIFCTTYGDLMPGDTYGEKKPPDPGWNVLGICGGGLPPGKALVGPVGIAPVRSYIL